MREEWRTWRTKISCNSQLNSEKLIRIYWGLAEWVEHSVLTDYRGRLPAGMQYVNQVSRINLALGGNCEILKCLYSLDVHMSVQCVLVFLS